MADFSQVKSSIHEERTHRIRILGTGAANPVIEVGQRVTITRTAAGVWRIDWLDHPGTFVGATYMGGALVSSDVKGQSLTRGVPVTSAAGVLSITFSWWSPTFVADELLATEYIDFTIVFAATKVP